MTVRMGSAAADIIDEHWRRRPAAALRPYVAWYSGYRQRGVPPARHRGLPSPFLTLIFTLDDPLVILAHPDSRQPPGDYGTLLGGLHSTPALIAHEGAQSGIQAVHQESDDNSAKQAKDQSNKNHLRPRSERRLCRR